MIKAIIFDLDGTLINRQVAFKEFLNNEFGKYTNDNKLIDNMIKDIIYWDDYGRIPRSVSFKKWEDKYQLSGLSSSFLDDLWKKESGKKCYLYDDVIETLKELKKRYKLAILTNGSSISQRRKLDYVNLYEFLDFTLISGEFEVNKPDPKIYRFVCEKLNLKPEECIYVGDTYDIDYLGAKNAGLNAVYVNRRNEEHKDTITIYNLKELLKLY